MTVEKVEMQIKVFEFVPLLAVLMILSGCALNNKVDTKTVEVTSPVAIDCPSDNKNVTVSGRVAYITAEQHNGKPKYSLQVVDLEACTLMSVVESTSPLMHPAWSPDGLKLAYVSFDSGRSSIFIQEISSGRRERVADYRGINTAPAWSPDGLKLAVSLSKNGNSDIFILDLVDQSLVQLTRDNAIDTDPSWSPDGKHIIWVSDRDGSPQIYRISSEGGEPERISSEGEYNSNASYSPDGKLIVIGTKVGRDYRIGVLNLESRQVQLISDGQLDTGPSFAQNGSVVVYITNKNGYGALAAISLNDRKKQEFSIRADDLREIAWTL